MSKSSSVQFLGSNKNYTNRKREKKQKQKEKQDNNDQVNLEDVLFSEGTSSIKSSIVNNDQNNSEESWLSWKERYHQSEDNVSIVKATLDNQIIDISEVWEVEQQCDILEYYPPFDYNERTSQAVPISINSSEEDEEEESIVYNKVNLRGTKHRSQSKYQKEKKKYRNLLKMKAYLIAKDEFKDKNGNIDPLDYPKDLINKRRDEILNILLNKK